MNNQNKKLIIFDFDGVLANTEKFCFDLHKKSNKNLSWSEFQGFCNGNFVDGIAKAINEKSHVIPDNFYDKYEKEIEKITVNSSIYETVKSLSENFIICIVSSTESYLIKNFLIKEKLDNYFSDILGADIHKDKTVKINSLLEKYNINSNNVVFITDSLGDILEGNKCGVKSIGVTWGIHNEKNLEKGNPVAIIDDPMKLLDIIQNVVK